MEEIISGKTLVYSLQELIISAEKFKDWIKNYDVAANYEVDILNEKINNSLRGISGIKVYMEKYNIEKLHNNFDLEKVLTSF